MKLYPIFYHQGNIDGLHQMIHIWGQKQSSPKNSCLGAFSIKGMIKLQFFTANMDSKEYIEILKNCKSDINYLHSNDILFLWDNESNNKSKISLDYYIENKIQLLEWPAYHPNLNSIKRVCANIKYKLRGNA